VAAPLFMSFFLGITIRESGVKPFIEFISGPVLYGATFFLGLLLGVLCEASTILNPKVVLLLILGITALLLSGIGGIIGGYIVYWFGGRSFNPVIGIAGVSCVPTTAKVAQKEARAANKFAVILPFALGASICGVITSAIITAIYVTLLR
jgi:oxaloacetate decarboxylase beta subunit